MSANSNVLDRIRANLAQSNQGGSFQASPPATTGGSPGNGISLQNGMITVPGSQPKKLGESIVS